MLFVDAVTGCIYEGNKKHMEGCKMEGGKPRKIKSSQVNEQDIFEAPEHWLQLQEIDDRY